MKRSLSVSLSLSCLSLSLSLSLLCLLSLSPPLSLSLSSLSLSVSLSLSLSSLSLALSLSLLLSVCLSVCLSLSLCLSLCLSVSLSLCLPFLFYWPLPCTLSSSFFHEQCLAAKAFWFFFLHLSYSRSTFGYTTVNMNESQETRSFSRLFTEGISYVLFSLLLKGHGASKLAFIGRAWTLFPEPLSNG